MTRTPQQTETNQHPAGWYKDPTGRHDKRFWSGAGWTNRVLSTDVRVQREEHTRTPAFTGGQRVMLVVASLCIFIFGAVYFVGFVAFH